MKKIILIAIIIMATNYAFSQNSLNTRTVVGANITNSYSSTATSSTFNRDFGTQNFLRSWNWGHPGRGDIRNPGRNLDDALGINSYHNYTF